MNVGAVGVSEDVARSFMERLHPMEKTAAQVKTRDEFVPGEIGRISDAWIKENYVAKQAAQRLIRRPGRLLSPSELAGTGQPRGIPEGVLEEDYVPGAIERLVKQAEGERKMQVTVRTGREAFGHLPDCPDMRERIQEHESVHGAIERLLLKSMSKEGVGATDTMIAGMAGQEGDRHQGPFGPAGSTVDYISRGLMGTGLGRTAGFLLKGRGVPEAIERRLGLIGAVGGLGLAAVAHQEQKRLAKEREAISRELAIQQMREALKKAPKASARARALEPAPAEHDDGGGLSGAIVPAVAGGAAGAIVPELVNALRSRAARAVSSAI